MNVVFRVDASRQMGAGHFMRCLALASSLAEGGAQVCFVSRNLPEYLGGLLAGKGVELRALVAPSAPEAVDELAHAAWLGTSQARDAADTIRALSGEVWDWLIVDHYALDQRWESTLRPVVGKVLVIDDLADRRHDCDILLDQNYYEAMRSRYADKVPPGCQLLLGPTYALLRAEFRGLRKQVRARRGSVRRLLVAFGGMDAENHTGRMVEALAAEACARHLEVHVVIGAQHPNREDIRAACGRLAFACHVQTDRMGELIASADLAIGAGGIAVWERCSLGLPTLALCAAENQRLQLADAARAGLVYVPDPGDDATEVVRKHVCALIENSLLREHISRVGMEAVDGRGTLRVARKLGLEPADCCPDDPDVEVRLAVAADAMIAWTWRNDLRVRSCSFDPSPISADAHVMWWTRALADPQRILLIGTLGGKEVGVVRYDIIAPSTAQISVYVDPQMTGRGLGERMLRAAQTWLRRHRGELDTVIAEIMPENAASLRAFTAADFEKSHFVYTWRA